MSKIRLVFSLALGLVSASLFGQTNTFPASGNVGIGIVNPVETLDVNGKIYIRRSHIAESGWGYSYLYWGTNSLVFGTRPGVHSNNRLELKPGGTSQGSLYSALDLYQTPSTGQHSLRIRLHSNGNSYFNGGNVGIGTNSPIHKLEVNGTIRAKEVKLEATNWPDYVFDKDYQLMPLEKVKTFIEGNGHLPGLKPAAEYEREGVNILELNQKLLEKVEELTLHLISISNSLETMDENHKRDRELWRSEIESLKSAFKK